MKTNLIMLARVYRKKEPTDYRLDNGREGKTYRVIIDDFESTAELKIDKEVYEQVEEGRDYLLKVGFDTEAVRKELKINGVLADIPVNTHVGLTDVANCFILGLSKDVKEAKNKKAE